MTLEASAAPLADVYDVALVDLDGVAYRGPVAIPHAPESLTAARAAGMGVVFITNNASREPGTVAEHLVSLGIEASPDEVLTSAQAAAALLATEVDRDAPVLVVGGPGLVTAVREAGFRRVSSADEHPVAVVQGFAPEVSWRDLAEAAYAIQRGARHVVSNLDLTLPNERGLAPGNGSLVGAVVNATGVTPLSAGKPEPAMYQLAVLRRGAVRPLVVGDRLDTDLGGARAAGYPGLHVLTGVSDARDAVLAAPRERPTFIAADLRGLLEAHPAPAPDADGWWRCGARAARVQGGELRLDGQGHVDIDLVRAACGAAWAAADGGHALSPDAVPELTPEAAPVHGR
ncbi:HAD-IIA family hydrolase [Actinotalea fermentans]|uniref:Haloacid dehalogenase n=1 Tax=Actinotalea fermentans TaxID=43671 RepID=A0A511YVE4_9CELL|nr:HAD-IIA family hydrolase [Actinotalea fermentans]KGM17196.1 HAD family hydrolase [Actinotalea fermentans ATCC 43279 = JCM 9966 = DSM 3133]GEN79182.1 haloacid dehalogenase [Actinotalea fermentans]